MYQALAAVFGCLSWKPWGDAAGARTGSEGIGSRVEENGAPQWKDRADFQSSLWMSCWQIGGLGA